MTRLLLAALLLLSGAAQAASPLATLVPFSASYEVRLNGLPFKANASQRLVALGNGRWRIELKVESFLVDSLEYSEFRWNGNTCHATPEHYHYSRKAMGRRKQLDLAFDHAAGRVTRNDGKATSSYAINENTEDKIGHTLALACRVARGERGTLTVDVAWDKDLRHLDYEVSAEPENIATPLGTFSAWRLGRQRLDSDRVTTTWVSGAAGWQSVRMEHTEGDGRTFQLRLLELEHAPTD